MNFFAPGLLARVRSTTVRISDDGILFVSEISKAYKAYRCRSQPSLRVSVGGTLFVVRGPSRTDSSLLPTGPTAFAARPAVAVNITESRVFWTDQLAFVPGRTSGLKLLLS
jgi:hypothetical protein